MAMFSRAQVGEVADINGKQPKRLLVALDGSSQDDAALLLARQLQERLGCQAAYLHLPNDPSQPISEDIAAILQQMGATPLTAAEGDNYDAILAAVDADQTDLLIVPCPFGRNFESLGEDSTGTVIDVLTARLEIPLIAIRRPDAVGRDPTDHLRMILTGENLAAQLAAEWAVGLAAPGGRLELLLLVEESFYENFREALHSIRPDVEVSYEDLENALATTYGKLHAAFQHTAGHAGIGYELLIRHEGDQQPVTPEDPKTHPALMVLGLQRSSHDSQGEVQEFIRRSPHPVLVVSCE